MPTVKFNHHGIRALGDAKKRHSNRCEQNARRRAHRRRALAMLIAHRRLILHVAGSTVSDLVEAHSQGFWFLKIAEALALFRKIMVFDVGMANAYVIVKVV